MPSNQKFGWLFALIFAVFFVYFQREQETSLAIALATVAIAFTLVTIFMPHWLKPLNSAWFALSIFLGKVVSPITLSIIFFLMIVPVALITRLFGRDELLLKKRDITSYWISKESIDPDSFKNQF